MITSNHIHLLLWVPRMADLSEMMHWLQGAYARDYNLRQNRESAFWRDRFHLTLIQSGSHLSRCLFYLDMNMVRAGGVDHPFEWQHGGARELSGQRQRNRIPDRSRLLWCLGMPEQEERFAEWYRTTLEELCRKWDETVPREPPWGSSFAVGSPDWLGAIGGERIDLTMYIHPAVEQPESEDGTHILHLPKTVFLRL